MMPARMLGAAAFALAILAASPAAAQGRSARFTVDRTLFTVPLPAGYCDEGVAVEAYRKRQRENGVDPVDVALMPCGSTDENEADLFTITVRRKNGANNRRAELLGSLADTLPVVPGEPDLSKEPGATATERLAARLVRRAGAGEGIGAIGVDDVCAYVGGRTGLESGRAFEVSGAGCTTVISGYILQISRYRAGADPAKLRVAIPEVRAVALSIGAKQQ